MIQLHTKVDLINIFSLALCLEFTSHKTFEDEGTFLPPGLKNGTFSNSKFEDITFWL